MTVVTVNKVKRKSRPVSKFFAFIWANAVPIQTRDIRYVMEKRPKDFDIYNIGTEQEIYIKAIFKNYLSIDSYFKELMPLPKIFMDIDRKKIKLLYGKKISNEEYYSYHYDNIIIRLVTALDLCGKIGNVVFKLGIREDKCNWYSFAHHKSAFGSKPSSKLISLAKKLEKIKNYRHQKVHKSKTDEKNEFANITYWEDFNRLVPKSVDKSSLKILSQLTDKSLKEEIAALKKIIRMTSKSANEFLDLLVDHIQLTP